MTTTYHNSLPKNWELVHLLDAGSPLMVLGGLENGARGE